MASTDARPVPRKNTAYRVTFPILDADGDLVTGATGLDSEVSIDAGAFADATNEATEIAASSGVYYLDLTAGEMNGDTIAIIVKTTSSGAKTTTIVMYPEEVGDYRADVVQISGDTTAADNAEALFDNTGYNASASTIGTATAIGTGGIATTSFAAGAIDAAAIAANAIGASEIAADAVAEIADGVWDEAVSGHTTQGTYGERQNAVISGNAVAGTLSTTQMTTDLTEATDDHYNGRTLIWTSGVLLGQATNITDYTGATKLLTYTAITEAPSAGDDFLIV